MITYNKYENLPHVVIIGGGFGGLYAAKAMGRLPVRVTLLDRQNYHLFQPLLYQVATGGLSPGDIASPLRAVLSKYKNISVLMAEAVDIDGEKKKVILKDGELFYDFLIVATGVEKNYFGHDDWEKHVPGLKTIGDSLEIRNRVFFAFEAAEKEKDEAKIEEWMTFVIVGAGPTGVELAGALGELSYGTVRKDFKNIDPGKTKIFLLEGSDRILPFFPDVLSEKAEKSLRRLGVTVKTETLVTDINENRVSVKVRDGDEIISAATVLWAVGIKGSPMGEILFKHGMAELDKIGRVIVNPDLTVKHNNDIFVIGDLANFSHQGGAPLPGVAPVAIQQGDYVARHITMQLKGKKPVPFRYFDKGSLAVIGRNSAVVDLGFIRFGGIVAWLAWVFIHIYYLIEFDNKFLVLFQWAWNYFTRKRGARLIMK